MPEDHFHPSIKETEIKENQMKPVRLKGKPIMLLRKNNQIFAVSNRCPHEGCSFEGGILRDYLLLCPCHGWKFDIRNGQYEENKAITLETYRCIIQNGKVFVEIR